MDKETLFKVLFKSDINSEQKFNEFSQSTPAGRRVIILVINLALGGKPSHMARKTCFVDNCSDCLKILNILSLHSTVDPRFSDTKFSDNPWFSDTFAADQFFM